jgi:hypothetical protein
MRIFAAIAIGLMATTILAQDIRFIDGDTFEMDGEVGMVHVRHDTWCPIYLGGGTTCLCRPDVAVEVDGVMYGEDGKPLPANDDDGGDHAA